MASSSEVTPKRRNLLFVALWTEKLRALAERKAQFERDLERSKAGAFGWLEKLIS